MLTISDIAQLYAEGVEVRHRRKPHPLRHKGEYDPSTLEINVFISAQESEEDYHVTLIHEFIHARDYELLELDNSYEGATEREAKETYKKTPEIIALMRDFYNIK